MFLICEPLEQAGFIHAFSTRRGRTSPSPDHSFNLGYSGSSSKDSRPKTQDSRPNVPNSVLPISSSVQGDARVICASPEEVAENRRRFQLAVACHEMNLITARQVHSAEVVAIRDRCVTGLTHPEECDALITDVPGVLLGVQTADCVPILIADVKRSAIAAIHAGWRGTRARIVEKTIWKMRAELGTHTEDCLVAMGPAACACCYEVGQEVIDQFLLEFEYAKSLISHHKPTGKANLDVLKCNLLQLLDAGVSESNVFTSGFCTLCRNDLFFSHRLEKDRGAGRMMSVIGVRP
jgi:polyphenol oxidase